MPGHSAPLRLAMYRCGRSFCRNAIDHLRAATERKSVEMHDECGLIERVALPIFSFRRPPFNRCDKCNHTPRGPPHLHCTFTSLPAIRFLPVKVTAARCWRALLFPHSPVVQVEEYNRSASTTPRRLGRQNATFFGINSSPPPHNLHIIECSVGIKHQFAMRSAMRERSGQYDGRGYRLQ